MYCTDIALWTFYFPFSTLKAESDCAEFGQSWFNILYVYNVKWFNKKQKQIRNKWNVVCIIVVKKRVDTINHDNMQGAIFFERNAEKDF